MMQASFTTTTTTRRPLHFDFLSLPTELKRRTAYFLATRDVMHLGQTCRTAYESLVLRRLQPTRWLARPLPPWTVGTAITTTTTTTVFADDNTMTLRRIVGRLPVWNRRVHSLCLQVQYQLDNATQRATCLYISAYPASCTSHVPLVLAGTEDDENDAPTTDGSGLGRVVASTTSPWGRVAGTNRPAITWRTRWSPQEGEVYYIWYASRSVRVISMELETRILDDPDSVVSRQYTKLARLGVLCHHDMASPPAVTPSFVTVTNAAAVTETSNSNSNNATTTTSTTPTLFYPQLLLHVAQSLRQCAAGYSLIQFWQQQAGLSLHTRDLAALEEILQADLEERQWRMVEFAEAALVAEEEAVH